MKAFFQKYSHALPAVIYMVIYMEWFAYVEKKTTAPYTVIHMKSMITFLFVNGLLFLITFGLPM